MLQTAKNRTLWEKCTKNIYNIKILTYGTSKTAKRFNYKLTAI